MNNLCVGFAKYTSTDNTTVHLLTDTPGTGVALPGSDPNGPAQRAQWMVIRADVHDVTWRADGGNPTASVGMTITAGQTVEWTGQLAQFRWCAVTSGAILSISYFTGPTECI